IAASGQKIVEALRDAQTKEAGRVEDLGVPVLNTAYAQLDRVFDPVEGGFGNAPKFPHPVTLNFLSRFYARQRGMGFQPLKSEKEHRQDATATADHVINMILLTLRKMAAGGMHDHVGGGFHRYSV